MRGSAERVAECTSLLYDGMIAMIEPSESWVARWQRIGQFPLPPLHPSLFIRQEWSADKKWDCDEQIKG